MNADVGLVQRLLQYKSGLFEATPADVDSNQGLLHSPVKTRKFISGTGGLVRPTWRDVFGTQWKMTVLG